MATTPAARTRTTRKLPDVDVALDLTKEPIKVDPPLPVRLPGGEVCRLRNVRDLDWQVAARLDPRAPFDFFENVVVEEDQEAFLAASGVTDKHMQRIIEVYQEKFDLGGPGA